MSDMAKNPTERVRCTPRGAGGDVALPVSGDGRPGKMKRSKMGPRRAAVLIGVHVLMVGHYVHFKLAGTTLSPVEPSEAMYTLRQGQLNAGFIFFAVALLLTILLGRFFCGWACHLVAVQDFCGWLMKKVGIKPKPFRSRLLMFVPLGLALYMFVYPSVYFWLSPRFQASFPGFSNHLSTDDFWKTFPGPAFAILTVFLCGFLAIYLLGAKGYCTYGCPYGGFFLPLDLVSTGKILVNDDCEQCGHCTANCTSNVRVHEEVKLYGMVVDPGCMKCLDCVSVCPNDALRFGLARPALFKGQPAVPKKSRSFDFTWTEEIVLAVVFLGSTLAMRGLYDGPPLLMSVALGSMTAFVTLKLWRLVRDPTVRIQNLKLKTAGKLGLSGGVFSACVVLWLAFTVHSGFVQWQHAAGTYHLNRTEVSEEDVYSGRYASMPLSDDHRYHEAAARKAFERADRWGLLGWTDVKRGMAWMSILEGDYEAAEEHIREAIALETEAGSLYGDIAKLRVFQGDVAGAIEAMEQVFEQREPTSMDHFQMAGWLIGARQYDGAVGEYRACVKLNPQHAEALHNLGGLLGRMGRFAEALQALHQAEALVPEDVSTQIELGMAYAGSGDLNKAVQHLQRALEIDPGNQSARMQLNYIRQQFSNPPPSRNGQPGGG